MSNGQWEGGKKDLPSGVDDCATAAQASVRVQQMNGRSNPVKKNMDKLHKPVTHVDKKKEEKKNPSDHVRFRKNWYERS